MMMKQYSLHFNQQKCTSNEDTQGVGVGLQVWKITGFCGRNTVVLSGDSHRVFRAYGMGMLIEIQSPVQPCVYGCVCVGVMVSFSFAGSGFIIRMIYKYM